MTSMDRRIYVDFDDILCETARGFTEVLEREFGKRVAFEEIFSFDLGRSFGLSPEDVAELMRRMHEADVLAKLQPVKGAIPAVQRWRRAGFEVDVVTGRPPSTRDVSEQWLAAHGLPFSVLIFVDKYARGHKDHGATRVVALSELCRMQFRFAVEDSPGMVRFLAENMSMPVAVLNRPWNADELGVRPDAAPRVHRCRDWAEIAGLFRPDV